ncbi:putative lipoprotein YmbA [Desulfobotulus alkaliphilus]|uniref:Putative lipoprotein YmbA n=1 Tax=Desulfobotulus alkaliphilus TaxID=622671 RepID=A0A562RIY9_9BACT|nr:PqiC family protein [Desulfobotulus alkaliphilus]TWI68883.1 putative lipoprotein YmbA [Desulfobotulus alkaliphilus]
MAAKTIHLFIKTAYSVFLKNRAAGCLIPVLLIPMIPLLSGCTATPQPRIYHLGISEPPVQKNERTHILVIETTSLPRHLDRPQLVTRNSETEIIIHERDRWAAPLDRLFRESLSARLDRGLPGFRVIPVDISNVYAGGELRIRIQILDFSSDIKGNIRLAGIFGFVHKTKEEKEKSFDFNVMAENTSPAALIAAHGKALDMLAEKIMEQVHP